MQDKSHELYVHLKDQDVEGVGPTILVYVGGTGNYASRRQVAQRTQNAQRFFNADEVSDIDYDARFRLCVSRHASGIEQAITRVLSYISVRGFANILMVNSHHAVKPNKQYSRSNRPSVEDFKLTQKMLQEMAKGRNLLPNYGNRKAARYFKKLHALVPMAKRCFCAEELA